MGTQQARKSKSTRCSRVQQRRDVDLSQRVDLRPYADARIEIGPNPEVPQRVTIVVHVLREPVRHGML